LGDPELIRAAEYLRDRNVDGALKMGQVLSERGISEEMGVSKSPVREALAQLRDDGLVLIEPQKGARVFTLDETEVTQICDSRQAIETATFEMALGCDHAGNDYLMASYTRYVGKIAALRTHLSKLPQHTDLSFAEYRKIAAATREVRMDTIRALLADHIGRTRQAYGRRADFLEDISAA